MDLLDNFYSQTALVVKEMEAIIPRNKEPKQVYGLIWEFLERGGKRFRPLLCLAAARAACPEDEPAAVKSALPAAAAIELFHNFTLIHDDIEDESELRRGKPCLHVEHGLPLAINAGDGLFMMVLKATQRIEAKKRATAEEWLISAFTSVLEGQAIELSWYREGAFDIREADYEKMVGGKTAALVGVSTRVGAYLGNGTPDQIASLAKFGYSMGVAFQIQDDVLNLVGDEKSYQKEIGGDIREGKRTLISIRALSVLQKQDAARLRHILSSQKTSAADIKWAISKMAECGAIDYAQKRAESLINSSISQLSLLPKSHARSELEQIAKYIIERKR